VNCSRTCRSIHQALAQALAASTLRGCAKTLVILDAFQLLQDSGVASSGIMVLVNGTTAVQYLRPRLRMLSYLILDSVDPTTAGHALFAERLSAAAFCGTGDQASWAARRPHGQPPPDLARRM